MGRHALTIWRHWKKTKRALISTDHKVARRDVCLACDKHAFDDRGCLRCTLKSCGCYLDGDKGRLKWEALPCDADKHDEIDKFFLRTTETRTAEPSVPI